MKKLFYPLVKNPFSEKDIQEGIKVLKSKQLTLGSQTHALENYFKKKFKVKFNAMVNSGSSANLLAFQTLINPYRKKRLKVNDEVLIPALCWPTSFWPIIQSNLKPIFVDCNKHNLNIDLNDLEKKITKKTKCLMLIHVLGHCANMDQIMKIVKKYKLILIEDNCEGIGSTYKKKQLGTYGDFSTFSFYSSHQISGGEGGMLSCKDSRDYQIIKTLRSHGWSRETSGGRDSIFNHKKDKYLDPKFTFCNSGYNLRPTETCAAIALSQLKRLNQIKRLRKINYDKLKFTLESSKICSENFSFIEANKNISECWLAFPIILKKNINRKKFLDKLLNYGIVTRPIISGDFSKQPVFDKYKIKMQKTYKNSNFIHKYGFYIGLYSEPLSKKNLNYLREYFIKSLD